MTDQPTQPEQPTVIDMTARHQSVQDVVMWFRSEHLPPHLQPVAQSFQRIVGDLLTVLPDSAEFTNGLRRLLEAKDSMVRCAVAHYAEETAASDARRRLLAD